MRHSLLAFGLLCLSEQVSLAAASKMVVRSPMESNLLHAKARGNMDLDLANYGLDRREALPAPDPIPQEAPTPATASPAEVATWMSLQESALAPSNNATRTACQDKLATFLNGKSSNPSGMSACYNVASFDNSTGMFQINVLLFMIGPETGDWEGRQPGTSRVELRMADASLELMSNMNPPVRRNVERRGLIMRQETTQQPEFQELVTFVGGINKYLETQITNMTRMREALTPNIMLFGRTTAGQDLQVELPNNEAGFVNGFFTDKMIADFQAQAPFVLPGTSLGFFPIGLVVTSIWALLFLGFVGAGTVGRYRFRTAYRRKTGGAGGYGAQGSKIVNGGKAGYTTKL